jgi:hypothetical protein
MARVLLVSITHVPSFVKPLQNRATTIADNLLSVLMVVRFGLSAKAGQELPACDFNIRY